MNLHMPVTQIQHYRVITIISSTAHSHHPRIHSKFRHHRVWSAHLSVTMCSIKRLLEVHTTALGENHWSSQFYSHTPGSICLWVCLKRLPSDWLEARFRNQRMNVYWLLGLLDHLALSRFVCSWLFFVAIPVKLKQGRGSAPAALPEPERGLQQWPGRGLQQWSA